MDAPDQQQALRDEAWELADRDAEMTERFVRLAAEADAEADAELTEINAKADAAEVTARQALARALADEPPHRHGLYLEELEIAELEVSIAEHPAERIAAWETLAEVTADLIDPARRVVLSPPAASGVKATRRTAVPGLRLDTFWGRRQALLHVRQAAHSRGRSATLVLLAVLARTTAHLHHTIALPPIVGGPAAVNLAVVAIGPSGAGKSTGLRIAVELLDIADDATGSGAPVLEGPVGSGEGIAEVFMGVELDPDDPKGRRTRRTQVRHRALLTVDEGEALTKQGERSGSALWPAARSAVMGERLGAFNAAEENRRMLSPFSYRLCLILGFQLSTAGALLDGADAGTPQRMVFGYAIDGEVPGPWDRPTWPGRLLVRMPTAAERDRLEALPVGNGRTVSVVRVASSIESELRIEDHQRQTGAVVVDELDSHRSLLRLKLALALSVLDGRLDVNEEDWDLAGQLADHSRGCQDAVRSYRSDLNALRDRDATAKAIRRTVEQDAAVETSAMERAMDAARRAVLAVAGKTEHAAGFTRNVATKAIAGRHRHLAPVDTVLATMVAAGQLIEHDGGRYGLPR